MHDQYQLLQALYEELESMNQLWCTKYSMPSISGSDWYCDLMCAIEKSTKQNPLASVRDNVAAAISQEAADLYAQIIKIREKIVSIEAVYA